MNVRFSNNIQRLAICKQKLDEKATALFPVRNSEAAGVIPAESMKYTTSRRLTNTACLYQAEKLLYIVYYTLTIGDI